LTKKVYVSVCTRVKREIHFIYKRQLTAVSTFPLLFFKLFASEGKDD